MRNHADRRGLCAVAALWIVLCIPAGAQDTVEAAAASTETAPELSAPSPAKTPAAVSGPIVSIEVLGLKRTKPHIARYALEQFTGTDAASLDENDVRAAVLATGVLEPVAVDLVPAEGGVALRVTVAEKWAVFPMPMFMADASDLSFGLFLMDTNAFGLRDQAMLGGVYGTAGWIAMAMYRSTPDRKGFPGWSAEFMYSSLKQENWNSREKILRSYETESLHLRFGLEYPLTRYLTVSSAFSFASTSLTGRFLNAPEDGLRTLGVTPGVSLRATHWDGYLMFEEGASVSYTYNLALLGSSYHALRARWVYLYSLVPGFLAGLRGGAVWKPGGGTLAEDGPFQAQVDILPSRFSALHYAGVQAGLEKYLLKTRYITLSAAASWQVVWASGGLSDGEMGHGPAGGFRTYLSRLAVPAVGCTVAYNMVTGVPQISFNMGMGF